MKKLSYICAALAAASGPALADQHIPSDVAPTCTVSQETIEKWFGPDGIKENGAINAPNSATFTTDYDNDPSTCDFYTWGAQMFLWLTSTDGGKHVFDGPGFFTVAPADKDNNRVFIANTSTSAPSFRLRGEKTDPPEGDDIGEIGQAGGSGVLMSQGKSLVYYGLMTNDTYAYFLTGQKSKDATMAAQTTFPSNASQMADLQTYLTAEWPKVTLETENQLAMELKTSWVEASTLAKPEDYITITGTVPNFIPADGAPENTLLIVDPVTPTKTVELALTGMHVVGTVQDHPEFVWATFEHVSNAPDAPYYYLANDGTISLNAYDSNSDFLFMEKGGAQTGANVECMSEVDGGIKVNPTSKSDASPICAGGIVPSNTVREYPWGSLANDPSSGTVTNNTLLVSINNSTRSYLVKGDARKNYIQTGSVWTTTPEGGGEAPIPNQGSNQALNLRGSTSISNMTMETYTQGTNCFSCHSLSETATNSFAPFGLSHIYSQLQPLTAAK